MGFFSVLISKGPAELVSATLPAHPQPQTRLGVSLGFGDILQALFAADGAGGEGSRPNLSTGQSREPYLPLNQPLTRTRTGGEG